MGDADDMDMDMDDGGEKTMDDEDKSGGKMMEDGMDTMDERQGGKYMQAAMKAVGEWQRVKSLSEFAKLSPLMDHLMLVGVAASWAATSAM